VTGADGSRDDRPASPGSDGGAGQPGHTLVAGGGEAGAAPVTRYQLVLHGILGTRANWRGLARRAMARAPGWGAVLADLREHGDSRGRPPPHTVPAAAGDLLALEAAPPPGAALVGALGHSFGGKVALAWAQAAAEAGRRVGPVILVDSPPGPRPGGEGSEMVLRVVRALEGIGPRFPDRAAFTEALAQAGQGALAPWLAMNLAPDPAGGVRFGPDLDVVRALLDDYFQRDLWPFLEAMPDAMQVTFVVGQDSTVFRGDELDRARSLAGAQPDRVALHEVPKAGHWVHTDQPETMVDVWVRALNAA